MRVHLRSLAWSVLVGLVLSSPLMGQSSAGRIVGTVVDGETGEPLPGAQIVLVGTQIGTLAGVGGRYTLSGVPAGTQAIQVTYIGHGQKTVEGITVPNDGTVMQNVTLASSAIAIEGLTVSATRENGSVGAALNAERTAVGVISSTTSEQISKSPDSDAAQAVQRVSGVTVRNGKYVFVRGLGERYTTTSLNGARVPSPEPEKKEVPLDLFPSSLLETITTSKTFTPDQSGDFSGAEVNLKTRSFPARRMFHLSVSGGLNSQTTGKDIPMPLSTGREWLAMAADQRALPSDLTSITDFTTLTRSDVNSLIRQLPNEWTFNQASGNPNGSASLSFGGEDPLFGHRIGYTGSLTYSRSQDAHRGEIRSRAVPGDTLGTPKPYNPFTGSTGQTSVLWGGLVNLSTYVGRNTRIELNNTYDRTADNSAHVDWGTLEEFQQVDSVRRTQLDYIERSVRSNQLVVDQQIGAHHNVSLSATSSGVTRRQPDRTSMAYGYEWAPTGERLPLAWLGFIPEAAKRTAADLTEHGFSSKVDYTLSLGSLERPVTFKVGGAFRRTKRDSHTLSYNVRALTLSPQQREATPEEIFYGPYTLADSAKVTLEPNLSGGNYAATEKISAGYAMAEVPLGSRVRLIGGARLEQWDLDMNVQPTSRGLFNIKRKNNDVLPSLALNVKLADNQNLRLSASQTLARPEYRELAPISYRDMLGEREVFGDSTLVRTLVQNYDVRWELYPDYNEVVSVAVFAKRFDKPIEQIDVATSGVSQLSFINAKSALNYGVEMELRKGLGFLASAFDPFSLSANVTLMKSTINTSNSTLSALTNAERPMVGQAPYVVNAGLAYGRGGLSANLLYNVVGRRITTAAVTPITVDTYEQPQHLLDFSVRFPIRDRVTGKLDATNLLDAPYEELQGDVIRYRYSTGRTFSFGVSWTLQ